MTNKDNEVKTQQILSKKCSKCKEIKPVSDFHKWSHSKDGFRPECKICHCREVAKYRKTPRGRSFHNRANLKFLKTEKGKGCSKRYQQSEEGRISQRKRHKKYRESEEGKAKEELYRQSEEGKATQQRYRHSEKGTITRLKAVKKHRSKKVKPTPKPYTNFYERNRQMKNANVNWDEIKKKPKASREPPTLNSRDWRKCDNFVHDPDHQTPGFYRNHKTDKLLIAFFMLDMIQQQIIKMNIENMPYPQGKPHIIKVPSPFKGKPLKFYIDPYLENLIKAYYDEFRLKQGAGPKDPFLASVHGHRLNPSGIGRKMRLIGKKLGIKYLSHTRIFKHTLNEREGRYNSEKKSKSNERKWDPSNKAYMSATDALKVAKNNNRQLSGGKLSKILKPYGPIQIRYMRQKKPRRLMCRVHTGDFMSYLETLLYIKPQGDQFTDEVLDEYVADAAAKQAEIREQKKRKAVMRVD